MRMYLAGVLLAAACASSGAGGPPAPDPLPAETAFDYRIGVSSESGDIITWIRPGHASLAVERVVPVGIMPADIDGPHNVAMAPDQRSYYVTIAHGAPYGTLWRMDAAGDTLLGRATLEYYPTTIALTPDGELAFVANSDFFGDRPRKNPVSVVHTESMEKIADVTACDMPHGVRVNRAGTRVYVTCMDSDELLELDVSTFEIARRARTGTATPADHAAHGAPTGSAPAGPGAAGACAPTYVSVSPDDRTLFVACNAGNSLQVWDAATLEQRGQVAVGKGAYNVEVSPDGGLVLVTNKKDRSVSLVDARSLKEIARIPTTKPVVHGVAWSPDGRYAYIAQEAVGADPGAVDMLDVAGRRVVATVPLPAQPTGITIHRR